MKNQKNNLDTFKTLHLVHGILALIASIFPLIYVGIGIAMMSGSFPSGNEPVPHELGMILVAIGAFLSLLFAAFGILQIYTSKFIGQRKKYTFIFVMAVITCCTGMLGLILGIFSIIELNKPEVKELFNENSQA